MEINQARTFLAVAAHGSFLEAARHLHVTQSTVSARIRRLEEGLGARLFSRGRAGAALTPAGRRFLPYAKRLVLTADQARDEVGLPGHYRASLRVGGRIALWDGFLPRWVGRLRAAAPDVVVRSEIGFEDDLMRRLVEGSLDLGLMYSPTHSPGLVVEHLFDETLVLVSTRPGQRPPGADYIYVEWGPGFYARHAQHFPEHESPGQVVNIGWLGVQLLLANGGSCFLPARMAGPLVESGRLHQVAGSPRIPHPAYAVYPRESDNPVLAEAIQLLRVEAERVSRAADDP